MLQLVRNQVGIEPIFDSDKSPTGLLFVPDVAKRRCKQGIVKSLGPDVEDIYIGDYVIFSAYDGTLIAFDKEIMIVMPETAIDARFIPDLSITLHVSGYTYSEVMNMISEQIKESDFFRNMKVLDRDDRKQRDNMHFSDEALGRE